MTREIAPVVDPVDEITREISPTIQAFLKEHRNELIAAGHFGPAERVYLRIAYPHFVAMTPVIVKNVVQAMLDKFTVS